MAGLFDVIQDEARRRQVVDDCVVVIDAEVHDKGGLSGIAIKGAYALMKGIRPGAVHMAMAGLLPDFAQKIDPFYERFRQSGEKDLRAYFARNGDAISEALLTITDRRAERNDHGSLKSAYFKLRPQASKHVIAALPRVADLVQKYVR